MFVEEQTQQPPVATVPPADENAAANIPGATAATGEVENKQAEQPEKTFTQAEVDALVQKRLLKEERRVHRRVEQQLREQQQSAALKVEPKREAFADDEEYLAAQIEHRAERLAAERIEQRRQADVVDERNDRFAEQSEKAAERYADFHTVVGNPALRINESMAEFITESDLGADVAYFLGKNPAQAAQIAALSPVKAARELVRIETELAARPKATPSKAPEPINPVGTRGKASASALPSDDDDIDTWMRKEQERTRRR
jgi:hypothetical protein